MFAHILFTISTASLSVITSELRQEQLFLAWQKAQDNTRSLVVELRFLHGHFVDRKRLTATLSYGAHRTERFLPDATWTQNPRKWSAKSGCSLAIRPTG